MKKLTMLVGAITLLAGTTLFAVNTNEPVVNKNINEKFNYSMNMEGRGRHHFPRGYCNDGRMGYIQNKEIERNRIDIMEKRLELRKELIKDRPDWKKVERLNQEIALKRANNHTIMMKERMVNPKV